MKTTEAWVALVNENMPICKTRDAAWIATRRQNPNLYLLMVALGRPAREVALANSSYAPTGTRTELLPEQEKAMKLASDASDKVGELVAEYQQKRQVNYREAWNTIKRMNPELFDQMNQGSGHQVRGSRISLENAEGLSGAGMAAVMSAAPPPVSGPNAALLGLFPGVDQDLFSAAYVANSSHFPPPLNAAKVFEAVANHIAKKKGISMEEAIASAKSANGPAYELWKLVEAAAR